MAAGKITVVQMLPDLDSGGVERGTQEMGKYLSDNGHRSIVISAGGRMVSQLGNEGSRHINWRVGKKVPTTLKYIWPLRRLLVQEKVDILHLRSRLPAWIGYMAWKSLPVARRPRLVTTFHGFYSVNAYSAVMAKGERVIAISKIIAKHVKETYGVADHRISVIYRGHDQSAFNPGAVSEDRIGKLINKWNIKALASPLIILPARLTPLKGHDFLLNSLALIKDLPWTALFIGDAKSKSTHPDRLRKMVSALGLEKRVIFTGHCSDMPAALSLSDIVVSTSKQPEAFGRTLVEALAMEKPVIATAHGGSLEIVIDNETGWLVPSENVERLAQALKTAITQKALRKKLGIAGRQWVREKFTTQKMCQQTVSLYRDLLG